MWELKQRPQSKRTETETETLIAPDKPAAAPKTPAPRSDGKPAQPYAPGPNQYWRWNERRAATVDPEDDRFDAAAYIVEVLHSQGVEDVGAYVGEVEQYMDRQQRQARRDYRTRIFKGR